MPYKDLEQRLAAMRQRQQVAKRAAQAAHVIAIHPHRETVLRNREAAREAARIEAGNQRMTAEQLQVAQKERVAFNRMSWYLKRQKKAVLAEKRVTAFYGCKTSWPRIEAHAIYAVVAEGQGR